MKRFLICTALIVTAMAAPPSQAADASAQNSSIDQLKRAYLRCDREANLARLPPSIAMACSQIAERLLLQAFGGDLEKLLAWWRTARHQDQQIETGGG